MAAGNPNFRTFPIPCERGHDVVYGLARGNGGEIYLAPSNEFAPGLCAAVYAFDPETERFREIIDIRKATGFDAGSGLMPHSKVHLCLQSTRSGRAFAATHFTAPAVGQTSFDAMAAFRGRYPGTYLLEYEPEADLVINHGLLVRGEGARIACLDERHEQYYFLSYPRNHLFRYDYGRRRLHDLGRMGQENAFGLEVDEAGDVYTSDDLGRFWRYSLGRDRLEPLDLYVPLAPGRSPKGNYIRRMALGADGCFYGCGNKGVRFFRLDPRRLELEDFGTLVGGEGKGPGGYPLLPPAKAIAAQADGSLLIAFGGDGIYADDDQVPRLVRFEPGVRRVTDLGRFECGGDGLPAWIPQCAVADGVGEDVYFGLQQTVGQLRLWRYHPNAGPTGRTEAWLTQHVAAVTKQPFGASVEGAAPLPFVRQGRAQMHELGWPGEDRVIPPGETAIGALVFGNDELLYGVTVGVRCHLFCYRPSRQNRFTENYEVHPWDLGVIGQGPAEAARLFVDAPRKRLIVAFLVRDDVELWAYPIGAEAQAYRGVYHSVPHGSAVGWTSPPCERLGRVSASGCPWESLTYHPTEDRFYGVGPGRTLVSAVVGGAFAHVGDVPTQDGHFPEGVTARAVAASGRLALGGEHGTLALVGGGAETKRLTLRRKVPVRALAWHGDDVLWGFAGGAEDIGEVFQVRDGELQELGILQVPSQPRYWTAHRCDAIAVSPAGEVFFGEFDRISHLFRVSE